MALDALDLVGRPDEALRCELLLALGETAGASDRLAAKKAFLEAASLARRLGLAHELAQSAAGYGGRSLWSRAGNDDQLIPLLEDGLAAIGEQDEVLRTRLLARLAGALRDEYSRERRAALSGEAIELARRTQDAAALAYALDGRAAAIFAPDTLHECLALGTELQGVAGEIGDQERVLAGLWNTFMVRVVLGEIDEASSDLAEAARITAALQLPVELQLVHASRAMMALAVGDLLEAEALIESGFVIGRRAQPDMSLPTYRLQRYTLRDFQGRIAEMESEIHELAAEYPARPVFGCVVAHLHARLDRRDEATRALEDLARGGFASLPFDQEWLYALSLSAEASAALEHSDSAGALYELLLPWADLNVADQPEAFGGAVSRYLGLLAATIERWDEAGAHFEHALAMNARMGARPWLAHTQRDYARMLLTSGQSNARAVELLAAARESYRELGMSPSIGA